MTTDKSTGEYVTDTRITLRPIAIMEYELGSLRERLGSNRRVGKSVLCWSRDDRALFALDPDSDHPTRIAEETLGTPAEALEYIGQQFEPGSWAPCGAN